MTRSAKITWAYIATFLLFTLTAVALRAAALINHMDGQILYFKKSGLITASAILIAVFAVFATSYLFTADKELKLYASFDTPRTYIPSGIVAIALMFLGGELFAKNLPSESRYAELVGISSAITSLTTLFAFACAVNFFLNVFHEKKESNSRAAFCLISAIFLGLYAGYLFFSNDLPINSPNKATDQLTYLALSIFFLYETRISLGRSMWKLYFIFGLISASLAFYSAIPSLVFFAFEGETVSNSLAENVLTLSLGIYVTSRITLVATMAPDRMCDTAKAFSEMAQRRCEDIKRSEKENGIIEPLDPSEAKDASVDVGSNYRIEIPDPSSDASSATHTQYGFNFDDNETKE